MSFTYETQGINTYLVYNLSEGDQLDNMGLGMLTNNKIPGFAPTFYTQMNSEKFIKYNVSAKDSVKRFFQGAVNKKRFINVVLEVVKSLIAAEDYMLDYTSIILDLDYIFVDVSSLETFVICLPVYNDEMVDLKGFFKNIVLNTQFDQTENCDYVIKILNFLNSAPQLSLPDFKILLEKIKNENEEAKVQFTTVTQTVAPQPQPQPSVQIQTPAPAVTVVKPEVQMEERNVSSQPVVTPVAPPAKPAAVPPTPAVENVQPEEPTEKMSLYYLLTHFDKENMATYKSQKSSDKEKTVEDKKAKKKEDKKAKEKPSKTPSKPAGKGPSKFAIPGQNTPAPSAVKPPVVPQPNAQKVTPPSYVQPVNNYVQPVNMPAEPSGVMQVKNGGFGQTTVLSRANVGQTTVLSLNPQAERMITPHLIRTSNNEKISLNKPIFKMGRERSYVDYCVSDNSAVSGSHAYFEIGEDMYYIIDTNSTNHTYLNGSKIDSNIKVAISHGDKIRLANEEFEFKLY